MYFKKYFFHLFKKFINKKKINFNNTTNINHKNGFNNIKPARIDNFLTESLIDKNNNIHLDFRKRMEKTNKGHIWVKICAWNMQRLNKRQINERAIKLEFIRDTFNENKFDIIYLIDVEDDKNILQFNGFNKFTNNRNILFVKNNINMNFIISKNIMYDPLSKLAFVYLTPNNKDNTFINNMKFLLLNNYYIIGDINIKSNIWINNYIKTFSGEDSLQTGFINAPVNKYYSIAGPSDHRLIAGYLKVWAEFKFALRIREISFEHSKQVIKDIVTGSIPKFEPKITIDQGYLNINDREQTMNAMINDYLDNNVRKIYKKYNYLWKYDRKEPFLGTKIPDCVTDSFALHLKEDINKQYKANVLVALDSSCTDKMIVKKTKSKAMNHEYISLANVTKGLAEVIDESEDDMDTIINNILSITSKCKQGLNAETFFLQKNKRLLDFNDVRVIVIIPTLIKIYESLIYDVVVDYFTKKFNSGVRYQFGGIKHGSTYEAMCNIRVNVAKHKADSVIFLDLSKGYDTILYDHLFKMITEDIDNVDIRSLVYNWAVMVYNMDMVMNQRKVKKTRGIAMGLSLSPVIFVWYVDVALRGVDKSKLSMYIDDLAIIVSALMDIWSNEEFINDIISRLENVGLIVNRKKTVLISSNKDVIKVLGKHFKVIDKDKYLGRQICLSGDGKIINDDRFFNIKGFRVFAIPSFCTFFIKRLIFNSALEAKLRYRLMMWSCNSSYIRNAIWKNNWYFFRSQMGEYSYLQLSFSIFNIFRYCIDTVDIISWKKRIKEGEDINIINKEVINKIKTEKITQLDDCFDNIKVEWGPDVGNEFIYTKKFLNNLWIKFRNNLITKYIEYKNNSKIKYYIWLDTYLNSRLYNHFGFIQNIVFKHADFKRRKKQLFYLAAFKAVGEFLEILDWDFYENRIHTKFNYHNIIDNIDAERYGNIDLNDYDNESWKIFFSKECEDLWKYVVILTTISNDAKKRPQGATEDWEKFINPNFTNIYVDGSYNSCNDQAGYGIIIERNNKEYEGINGVIDAQLSNKYKNIVGELLGTIKAVQTAIDYNFQGINLIYDYKGVEEYATGGWYSDDDFIKENYIYKMKSFRNKIKINFIKVKSHSGVRGNSMADDLARAAVKLPFRKIPNEAEPPLKLWTDEDINYIRSTYKILFKICTVIEMISLNNNLFDLNLEELLLNMRIKMNNLDDLLEKMYRIVDFADFDLLETNFYDLYKVDQL